MLNALKRFVAKYKRLQFSSAISIYALCSIYRKTTEIVGMIERGDTSAFSLNHVSTIIRNLPNDEEVKHSAVFLSSKVNVVHFAIFE